MGLPRTFVGFSSTDLHYYRLMQAWKSSEHIDFDFADCQLEQQINSENEAYIKKVCKDRILMAGTFIQLIGDDTRTKHKYVRWELETAIEKNCRIIGVNLDNVREKTPKCPPLMDNIGAVFVPFKAKMIAKAIQEYEKRSTGNWRYSDIEYVKLGL